MKLSEIRNLQEEAIEIKPAQDVWADGKDNAKTYISSVVYLARPLEDDEEKYEVYVEEGDGRKLYAKMDAVDFDQAFVKVSKTAKPDVEGFEKYRDSGDVEAFKYEGDTVKLDADGKTLKLSKGDYLIKSDDGDNFVYFIEKAKDFEAEYEEK